MTKCLPQADYMKLTVFYFVKRLLITYLKQKHPPGLFAPRGIKLYWKLASRVMIAAFMILILMVKFALIIHTDVARIT